ncbi:hypothetical protein ACHWQZ_G007279 [Mnemiopsis leidyi]
MTAENRVMPHRLHLLFIILLPLLSESSESRVLYTTPTIISSIKNGDELKIGLRHNSTDIVILLHKNREVSGTYKILVQEGDGDLVPHRKAPSCQYTGHVVGQRHSLAVLSICDGIRGKVQFGRTEFHIRPVEDSPDKGDYHRNGYTGYGENPSVHQKELEARIPRKHELFKPPVYDKEVKFGHVDSGDRETVKKSYEVKSRQKRLTSYTMDQTQIMKANVKKLERRYMEVSVIIDRAQYVVLGRNQQRTTDFVEEVMNHIGAKFKPYNIIIAVVQLVIWKDRNPESIPMPDSYTRVLENTSQYRRNVLLDKQESDITIMITGTPFNEASTIGGAYTDQMCDPLRSTNINYDTGTGNKIPYLATLIAHEVGHVMGMYHDVDDVNMNRHKTCDCPCRAEDFEYMSNYQVPDFCPGEPTEDRCIMYPTINRDYTYFSLCSRRTLEENLHTKRCLSNAPKEPVEVNGPLCGNAIIEPGETCDCGNDEDCPILDPCCEVGTCQLKNTSSCFTGACCSDTCQFKPKGTLCRGKSEGMECDFEETCTGTNSVCPRDTYKQDGRTCRDTNKRDGFCSRSDCLTLLSQCQKVFGPTAKEAGDECWDGNKKGYWQGNCGYGDYDEQTQRYGTYYKCEEENKHCGLLNCLIHKDNEREARAHVMDVIPNAKTTIGMENPRARDDPDYKYRCATVRFSPSKTAENEDEETDGFVDLGQVLDFTSCGEGLFCMNKVCTYEEPTKCPSLNGTECGGHGECNNLNQCHCDKDWGSDLCVDFGGGGVAAYKTIIIILCIAVVLVPLIVGVLVFIFKHKFDMQKMKEEQSRIARGIRRFSSRAFSRQGSTRSDISVGNVKMPAVTKGYKSPRDEIYTYINRVRGTVPKIEMPTITMKPDKSAKPDKSTKPTTTKKPDKPTKPSITTPKPDNSNKPNGKAKKIETRVPPPPPPPSSAKNRFGTTPKPANNLSPLSSNHSSPNSSNSRLNSSGPPPVPPPPAPEGGAVLRNAREGLRPARMDARTHSETFKNKINIPTNSLSDKPVSESNLAKKPLQAPKLLAGRSRESKKLQISGPSTGSGHSLTGLDGRPKSLLATTDIKQAIMNFSGESVDRSSDSVNTVSSTRALFDPKIKKKPPSRWN